MSTPAAAEAATHSKNCQDESCESDYDVVIVRVEAGTVDFLCDFHHLLMMMGVAHKLGQEGILDGLAGPAEPSTVTP